MDVKNIRGAQKALEIEEGKGSEIKQQCRAILYLLKDMFDCSMYLTQEQLMQMVPEAKCLYEYCRRRVPTDLWKTYKEFSRNGGYSFDRIPSAFDLGLYCHGVSEVPERYREYFGPILIDRVLEEFVGPAIQRMERGDFGNETKNLLRRITNPTNACM